MLTKVVIQSTSFRCSFVLPHHAYCKRQVGQAIFSMFDYLRCDETVSQVTPTDNYRRRRRRIYVPYV